MAKEPEKKAADEGQKAPYPPPASDRSGERTATVPPAKQVPAKAPADGGADELTVARAEIQAYRTALTNLGINADAVKRAATEGLTGSGESPVEDTSHPKFAVSLPGQEPVEVHAKDEADAKRVYMAKHGVWSLPHEPTVTKADAKKKADDKE